MTGVEICLFWLAILILVAYIIVIHMDGDD